MPKVLVVEDEPDLARLLGTQLGREGYAVVTAMTGPAAVEVFGREHPDLILLDLMLPGMDGMDVLKVLRRESSVPVIILTARSEEVDRVLGLELGADDYVTKPFSIREVMARVRARLRPKTSGPPREILTVGRIEVDHVRHEVRADGALVSLTIKEFSLLGFLAKAPGRAFTREELLQEVWGYERASELDTRTVDQHMARLRRKLGESGERLETVKGHGYKLAAA